MTEIKKDKLKAKDLVFIGVFDAIIFVLMLVIAAISGIIPGVVLFVNAFIALLVAPVFMLMIAKVNRTGVFAITGIVFGLLYLILGNPAVCVCFIVSGVIAEWIASSGRYKTKAKITLSYIVFMIFFAIGVYGPAYFFTQFYIDMYAKQGYSPEYFEKLLNQLTIPMGIAILAAVIIAGYIGTVFSNKMLKKHFEKAGII